MAANNNHMNCLRYIFAQVFMTNDNFDNGSLAIHATTAD